MLHFVVRIQCVIPPEFNVLSQGVAVSLDYHALVAFFIITLWLFDRQLVSYQKILIDWQSGFYSHSQIKKYKLTPILTPTLTVRSKTVKAIQEKIS
jgi:hypothetical protein